MKEIEHTIPEEYLNEIVNSPTRRHARILAGWLNRSHGTSRENRRAIQASICEWTGRKSTGVDNGGKNENHL